MRVLVVDDDPVNRVRARALLVRLGATAVEVASGNDALAALEGEAFGLVLMDLDMPEMSGIDAVRRIRELEAGRSRVPVLALTAADDAAVQRCLAAGMDGFVAKPLELEALAQLLGKYESEAGAAIAAVPASVGGMKPAGFELDAPYALARVFGDRALYAELLTLFASRYRGGPGLLQDPHVAEEERRRLIHSLISSSAAIGASALSAAAKAVQNGEGGERAPDSPAMKMLAEGLRAVLANVDTLLSDDLTR